MSTFLHLLFEALVLFAFVWAAIFGGLGALLAHKRNGSPRTGMALGTLLGPIGWAIVWWRTRTSVPGQLRLPTLTGMESGGWDTL
jgi:hypothetical protein